MLTLHCTFLRFERMMNEGKIWLDPTVSFPGICRVLGVSIRRFNRFLTRELGFTGDEILYIYRASAYKKD